MILKEILICIIAGVGFFITCVCFISLISKIGEWALNKWKDLDPSIVLFIWFWGVVLFSLFLGSSIFYKLHLIFHT